MPIASSDLKKYAAANHPESDSGTVGGAINTAGTVVEMSISGNTAPKVASSNAGDTTQTITIVGRDAAGVLQTENQTLNGTTQVSFSTTFERILRVSLSASAAGTVTVYENDGSTVVVTLAAGITSNRTFFIDASSSASPETRYEKFFFKNEHGSLTLTSAGITLTADAASKITIGVENSADDSSTNRTTAPSGVTFVDDSVEIDITSLAASADIGVWVRQSLSADDAAVKSTFTVQLAGTTT